MRLILLRHGPAGSRDAAHWPDDAQRPLSPKGEDRTRLVARGLAKLENSVAAVLTSPLTRADATARIVAETLKVRRVEALDSLAPGGAYRAVIQAVSHFKDDDVVILVGHEPDLGKLAGTLLFGAPAAVALKKAGACSISFDGPVRPGEGRLNWFLSPRILRRLAGKRARV
jgi:phosphohistidine phosphatase